MKNPSPSPPGPPACRASPTISPWNSPRRPTPFPRSSRSNCWTSPMCKKKYFQSFLIPEGGPRRGRAGPDHSQDKISVYEIKNPFTKENEYVLQEKTNELQNLSQIKTTRRRIQNLSFRRRKHPIKRKNSDFGTPNDPIPKGHVQRALPLRRAVQYDVQAVPAPLAPLHHRPGGPRSQTAKFAGTRGLRRGLRRLFHERKKGDQGKPGAYRAAAQSDARMHCAVLLQA